MTDKEYQLSNRDYAFVFLKYIKKFPKEKILEFLKSKSKAELDKVETRIFKNYTPEMIHFLDGFVNYIDMFGSQSQNSASPVPITIAQEDYYETMPEGWKPLTKDERWAIANDWIKNKRKKLTPEEAQLNKHKRSQYPFFINPYKKIDPYKPHEDLDLELLIYMMEHNVVGYEEFENLLVASNRERGDIIGGKTERFDAYNCIPENYRNHQNKMLWYTLQDAAFLYCTFYTNITESNYDDDLKDENVLYWCYFLYLTRGIGYPMLHTKHYDEIIGIDDGMHYVESATFADRTIRIKFRPDEEEGVAFDDLVYEYDETEEDKMEMFSDIILLYCHRPVTDMPTQKFKDISDLEKNTFDVFGKTYSLLDMVKAIYTIKPTGDPYYSVQTFFRGYKEAFAQNALIFKEGLWQKSDNFPDTVRKILIAPCERFFR